MRDIRIGLGVADSGGSDLEELLAQLRGAEAAGFHSVWIPNIFGMDALTLAALAGRETRTLEIGTAVVPTFSRHPLYMAQQALSTQAACVGRFVLGIGPSHRVVIENMLGLSFERPARHVREYVTVVRDLLQTGSSKFEGETLRVNASLDVKVERPCPLLIGALGPQMRKIAGRLTDGTITWMTGPRTLGESLVPELRAAAEQAGRPAPRVVAGFPVVVTADPPAARRIASQSFAIYGQLPSYRAMLDFEGAADPADLAIAGDERAVEDAVRRLAAAGVTDFHAVVFADAEGRASVKRTRALLSELSRS